MSNFDTHVCLVSAQAAPNLLPMLDESLKPRNVVLLVTPQMEQKGQWLADVIRPRGIKVDICKLDTAANFDAIQEILMEILGNVPNDRIALNATGGTKWMAIAAQDIFRMNNSPVFYVDAETDRVMFLGGNNPPHTLTQRIDIENYLRTYGYHIVHEDKSGLPVALRDLCEQMVLHVTEWESALGHLNRLASEGEEKKSLRVAISDATRLPIYFDRLLGECHAAGVITNKDMQSVIFADDNARKFCNGGWLEAYVNRLLGELRQEGLLQDSPRLNMEVKAGDTRNEIDVAFMAKNRLHIIECKTKRFSGQLAGQAGAETVYKLDSLSELGGIGTKAMLVSYRKLRPADRQRAQDLRIRVVESQQIQQLKALLKSWINAH